MTMALPRTSLIFRAALCALFFVAMLAGCDDESPAAPEVRWPCPGGWVASEYGGCGPAVLLCGQDGGSAPGVCQGADGTPPAVFALPDGGTVRGFRRLPDGGLGGAWPEPGDPDGPPPETWAPDAGIASCLDGWRRLEDGTCDPALPSACPEGAWPLPGGRCTPTADVDCPATTYADLGAEAMGARVVHVRAGADASIADGSEARPFATVIAGVAAVRDGGWVRVAAGEYPGSFSVQRADVHVVGVCASRVTLRGSGSVTIDVQNAGTRFDLRGVTVRGTGRGVQARSGADLHVTGVVIADAIVAGVLVGNPGTRVVLRSSAVRGTREGIQSDGRREGGHGVEVIAGATLSATGLYIDDNVEHGVYVTGARTTMELASSVVRGTRPSQEGGGRGLTAHGGASLRATGVLIDGNASGGVFAWLDGAQMGLTSCVVRGTRGVGLTALSGSTLRVTGTLVADSVEAGVVARGAGARVELVSSVVRGTRPSATVGGVGAQAGGSAVLTANGVLFNDNRNGGVTVVGAGSRVELASSVVRGTRAGLGGMRGHGLSGLSAATLRATDSLVVDNDQIGVYVADEGTQIELTSSVVRDTRPLGEHLPASGLTAESGGTLRADRVLVWRNPGVGVGASGEASRAELTACVIRETRTHGRGESGIGLAAERGAALRADRVLVEGNTSVGVVAVGSATEAEITGCAIRNTRPTSTGYWGRALEANGGASLRATATLMDHSAEIGAAALDANTRLVLIDSAVTDVVPGRRGLGVGVGAFGGAALDATRLAVVRVAGAGVVAVGGAASQVTARDVFVRGVRRSTVRFSDDGNTVTPEGAAVAYCLHASPGGALVGEHVTAIDGDYGFFNAGAMTLRGALIASQHEAAGARAPGLSQTATQLRDVVTRANAAAVQGERELPSGGAVPVSRPLCPTGMCAP